MQHKSKEIEVASASLLENLKRIIPLDTEEISRATRLFMDSKELRVYDLAVFYHQEMLKSQKSEAYLAACLMCGATNEALLTLTCLRNASDVSKSNQFASSTKKKSKAFSDVVAGWGLDQLINVAEELNWVPADVVDEGVKTALAEAYREVAPINHPEM